MMLRRFLILMHLLLLRSRCFEAYNGFWLFLLSFGYGLILFAFVVFACFWLLAYPLRSVFIIFFLLLLCGWVYSYRCWCGLNLFPDITYLHTYLLSY